MGLRSSTTTELSLAPMHFAGENGATVWRLAHMCREGMEEKGGERACRKEDRRERQETEEEKGEWVVRGRES